MGDEDEDENSLYSPGWDGAQSPNDNTIEGSRVKSLSNFNSELQFGLQLLQKFDDTDK